MLVYQRVKLLLRRVVVQMGDADIFRKFLEWTLHTNP